MGRRLNKPEAGQKAVLSLRVDFADGQRLGPGKIVLLEAIAKHGSISAAGRAIGMSYKRAWDLIEELNTIFGAPVIDSKSGGSRGGGARLNEKGQRIVAHYREIEKQSKLASKAALRTLLKDMARSR